MKRKPTIEDCKIITLPKVTDPRGNYRQYNYTSGRVTSIRDEGANTPACGYDSNTSRVSRFRPDRTLLSAVMMASASWRLDF